MEGGSLDIHGTRDDDLALLDPGGQVGHSGAIRGRVSVTEK
jgi:hypothetical protein